MTSKFNIQWKQNLRKIPDVILTKVKGLKTDNLVVACVKKISAADISGAKYSHLNISLEANKPLFLSAVVPNAEVGRYSRANVEGKEIVRNDLPMVSKDFTWEVPDYGDWSLGSHDITISRDVYIRDFIAPKELALTIELIGEEIRATGNLFVFKFSIDEDLNRTVAGFEESLLFNLNLLQENVGNIDVFASDAKLSDYLTTVFLDWEILPPGEGSLNKIISGIGPRTPEIREKLIGRYKLLNKLNPIAYISGTCGFRRYFGALFTHNLVVFENLEFGNAIYVMFEDWASLSKLSRLELLSSHRQGFERIVHRHGWEKMLIKLMKEKKKP